MIGSSTAIARRRNSLGRDVRGHSQQLRGQVISFLMLPLGTLMKQLTYLFLVSRRSAYLARSCFANSFPDGFMPLDI